MCLYFKSFYCTYSFHDLTRSIIEELNTEDNMERDSDSKYDILSCYTICTYIEALEY